MSCIRVQVSLKPVFKGDKAAERPAPEKELLANFFVAYEAQKGVVNESFGLGCSFRPMLRGYDRYLLGERVRVTPAVVLFVQEKGLQSPGRQAPAVQPSNCLRQIHCTPTAYTHDIQLSLTAS